MLFEDTAWFSILTLASTQSIALITSFYVMNFLFKNTFSFLTFSVDALTVESGLLNAFVWDSFN